MPGEDATISLGIDASQAKRGEQEYRRSMDSIKKSSKEGAGEVDNTSSAFKRMSNTIAGLKPVIAGFVAAFSLREVVRAGAEMQNLNARLLALTGSSRNAGEAMRFLRQTAQQQSVDLIDLANGYSRLLPSVQSNIISMEEMRTILQLANDNIKAFGLSTAETQGLFLGLSQTFGSGTVTMEDLRQVTDRLPGLLNKTAEAAGLTVNEFKKLVSEGTLTADLLKGPLLQALKANEGAAKEMSGTFDSATIAMKNAWRDLLALIADTGTLDFVVGIFQGLADTMTLLGTAILKVRILFNQLTGDTDELIKLQKRYIESLDDLDARILKRMGLEQEIIELEVQGQKEKEKGLKGQGDAAKAAEEAQKALAKIVTETLTPTEKYKKTVEEIERLRPFAKSVEEMTALDRAITKAGEELEEAKKKATEAAEETGGIAEAFENAVGDMKDASDDFFTDFFKGKINDATSLFDRMKDAFARMLGEMATLAITRPILLPIAMSVGGALGVPSDALGQVAQGFGGGGAGGLSGIDALSGVKSVLGLSGGSFLGGFGAVNQFGANYLGTGLPGLAGGATSLGLSGILAGGGIGGLGASLLGLGNENPLVNTGASLAGGYLASLALTPILGPFAPILGGFAGSALAGLFGKKPSSKLQTGEVDLTTGQIIGRTGLTGKKFSQENFDAVTQYSDFAASVANAFTGGRGLDSTLGIGIGGRGYSLQFGDGPQQQFASDPKKFAGEIVRFIAENIDDLDETLETALGNISFDDLEAGLNDLDFALNFTNLALAPKKISAMEQALIDLEDSTNEAAKTARRLGLEEERVYELRDQQLATLRSDFGANIQARILSITDPEAAALQQLDTAYATIRRDAIAIGFNLAEVEKAYGVERLRIVEQYRDQEVEAAQSAFEDIRRYRESILVSSSVSGLSSEERRREAVRQFTLVQGRYASGDASFQDVQTSINNLLDASKDYYSFTEGYFADQASALAYLETIEKGNTAANDNQAKLVDIGAQQTKLLEGILEGVSRQLVDAASLANDPRLLRSGESFGDLSGAFNTKNQLPALLVRQFKLQSGYDFSDPTNAGSNFASFAAKNPAALSLFNELVKSVGGVPQYANGGYVRGGVPGRDSVLGMLKPGEYVVPVGGLGRNVANDNVVASINRVVKELSELRAMMFVQNNRSADAIEDMSQRLGGIEKAANRTTQRRN